MNELICTILGLIAGFAVATWRALRTLHRQRAELLAAQTERAELAQRNTRQAAQLIQMQQREYAAAANIVQLSHALRCAVAQVEAQGVGVGTVGAPTFGRFSLN